MKSIKEKAEAYDKVRKKIAIRFGSNVADEFFAEFEKSKDDRIREGLTEFLEEVFVVGGNFNDGKWQKSDCANWLSWLRKQEDHANFVKKAQVGDRITKNEDGVLVNLSQFNRVAKKNEKQGEQEPIDKVEPKYPKTLDEAIDLYYYTYGNKNGGFDFLSLEKFRDIVKTFIEEYGQKPAEWSEEDEKMMAAIEHHLNNCGASITAILWLKSLKDRVGCEANCTTTKEWSEEDKKKYNDILAILRGGESCYYNTPELFDWLKSLKDKVQPQNRWKPSKTDIMILEKVFNGKIDPKDFQVTLLNVLEQLKKLKEGKV